MSSRGRAVLATRAESAGQDAGPAVTASRAEGAAAWVIVTAGPVVWPPAWAPTLVSPHPASRTAVLAASPPRRYGRPGA